MKSNREADDLLTFCKEHGAKISQTALLDVFDGLDLDEVAVLRIYSEDETISVEVEYGFEVDSDFWPDSEFYVIDRSDYNDYST